ncbi:NAD(P)-dependent dehydrogenase (short-subunit alcohol dehydrogenase family) [Hasllibacter halocynthiae]|uniref:NAD(P)-dependent dehydrogenase (Short-subunit alcohol dehydrogenase family) n=1 Tax=Hasllibacter halocynthiae TaxID=595589 RepID=A0A2T0X485_9RHOB|nr:SDR family oxidoreductase [Hasllibacter halocynthiae]PRY93749.1 NAD(P)-dependent dehydrogenase (short-subunit alcohol dehydrogenase family) [Hasllibacter halocynthiae]
MAEHSSTTQPRTPPKAEDIPPQSQDSMPANEYEMDPPPDYAPRHPGVGKLKGKVALITGGDSGIGRATAVLFAREGARIAVAYLEEDRDAEETRRIVEEEEGSECLLIPGDLGVKENATRAVEETVSRFGALDVLVNNGAQQWLDQDFGALSEERMRRMIESNIMGYLFTTQAALPHLKEGASIINTTSINAFAGNASLITYSTTRGATLAFSRSMAKALVGKGIRVNAVAPGPIWTPFIPGTMPAEEVEGFGGDVAMGRPGQPWEVATAYLFFASSDGSYYTGQTLHPNGGEIVGA